MAVDTAAKRYSMMAFARQTVLPIPDGTIAQADRQHLLMRYGGILWTTGTVSGPYSCAASEVFQAGAVAGQVYQAGEAQGETFQAGAATTGEVL